MININCKVCSKEKSIQNGQLNPNGNCCSKLCYSISLSSKVNKICEHCNNNFEVYPSKIKNGGGKFCSKDCSYSNKREKLIGKKIGKLLVIKYSHTQKIEFRHGAVFNCLCDCGNEKEIFIGDLTAKKVTSCGCKPSRHNSKFGNAAFNIFYNGYKAKANDREIFFGLTKEEFMVLTSLDCHYCGESPKVRKLKVAERLNGQYPCNGIDRVDSDGGYTVINCVPCCSICNTMKMALSEIDFTSHIEKIYNHQQNKKSSFPISYLTVIA